MASERAVALMRAHAMERIDAATATLGAQLGITFDPPGRQIPTDDPHLRRARDLGRMAGLLEQIVAATAPKQKGGKRNAA